MPRRVCGFSIYPRPSMKVPPKRKGNPNHQSSQGEQYQTLNESPSEKEGKFVRMHPGVCEGRLPQ